MKIEVGQRVVISLNANEPLLSTSWWPKGRVTGTVQKVYKNGSVSVAVHQLRNFSADRCQTINFNASDLVSE